MKSFETDYLHGFTRREQERLLAQADFLEPYIFSGVDLEFRKNCLEVGCGVGAQTQILLRRFPHLKIIGLDLSKVQLTRAQKILAPSIRRKRIELRQANAQNFNFKEKFDSAFLCWFLEHVPDPLRVLQQTRRHLNPGAKIYCSEVFNQTLFLEPYSPAFLQYWFQFNDLQWSIQGHPFVGAELGHLLNKSGFTNIQVEVRPFHFDSRSPEKRAAFVEFFFQILLSAEKTLLQKKRVTKDLVQEMRREVDLVKKRKDSVFFYAFVRATGETPR